MTTGVQQQHLSCLESDLRPRRLRGSWRSASIRVRPCAVSAGVLLPCLFALAFSLSGCGGPLLGVNVFVVGERTSLEKQVLGNYRALNADFESFGSVRGVDEFGQIRQPPPVTDSKRAAVLAMQNRAYNRDDVTDFLRAGFFGENNQGTLTLFDEALDAEPPARQEFIRAVAAEENEDRETLIRRLIETTPGVRPEDHGRVRSLFASLNRDTAPTGSRVQREDDTWSVK